MSIEATTPIGSPANPAYARFSRRIRALFIDWIVAVLVLFGSLFVAVQLESDHVARVLGVTVVLFLLLYEPVLVSLTGSTIGHYLTNLRVVDNRSHGNVNFAKALARLVIKDFIGLYSFITMAITRRHQAVHDLLTHSTVQVRDISTSSPHDYVEERVELASPRMPSLIRRIVVIGVYQILLIVGVVIAVTGLLVADVISTDCLSYDFCTRGDERALDIVASIWLVIVVLCGVQGWRGRLPGARVAKAT